MSKSLSTFLSILFFVVLFGILATLVLEPWLPSYKEMKVVKVGVSADSVLKIIGEPREVELEQDCEEWTYKYHSTKTRTSHMVIYVKEGVVSQFFSY